MSNNVKEFVQWALNELSKVRSERNSFSLTVKNNAEAYFLMHGINSANDFVERSMHSRTFSEVLTKFYDSVTKDDFLIHKVRRGCLAIHKEGETVKLLIFVNPGHGDDYDDGGVGTVVFRMIGEEHLVEKYKSLITEHIEKESFTTVNDLTGFNASNGHPRTTMSHLTDKSRLGLSEFYPTLKESIPDLVAGFEKSSQNGMLLMSEPGCGKSALLRAVFMNSTSKTLYLVNDDSLLDHANFIPWIKERRNALIVMEDVDRLLVSRDSGNSRMAALLNTIEGVLQPNVKFIFSTNLGSTRNIDSALLRPGRLYRHIKLGKLSYAEAMSARKSVGFFAELPENPEGFTLGEALNYEERPDFAIKTKLGF